MPSKTPLMSLPSFKFAILVPVFFACLVWGAMYRSGLPDLCWSPDCFNYAFELFKVPLALLALIFPAVALVASHHRSVQTAAQIKASEDKNTFENYLKHREYFSEFVEEVRDNEIHTIKIKSASRLYSKIFKNNTPISFVAYEDKENILDYVLDIFKTTNAYLLNDDSDPEKNKELYVEFTRAAFALDIKEVTIYTNEGEKKIEFDFNYKFTTKNNLLIVRNALAMFLSELFAFSSTKNVEIFQHLKSYDE